MYEKLAGTLITALVPMIIKWVIDNFSKDKVKIKKQRIDDLSAYLVWPIENQNRLIIQEKFQYFFKHSYTFDEIIYCLNSNNPMHALDLIKKYYNYIELNKNKDNLIFKDKYSSKFLRCRHGIIMNSIYFIFAFLGLMPIAIFNALVTAYGISSIPFIFLFSVFMIIIAMLTLNEASKPRLAEAIKNKIENPSLEETPLN